MHVSVIGAAGHVGLGLCLVLAEVGHQVVGIDRDLEKNALISSWKMPHTEKDGAEYLSRALDSNRLTMTDDLPVVASTDVVIIVIGTPLDENLNPDMAPLLTLLQELLPHLRKGQLLILRSTVSPGTTDLVKSLLEQHGLVVGDDITLTYAPERVAQGKAISELRTLPQLIGVYDSVSYDRVNEFFESFVEAGSHRLSPLEAEVGKLVTNMTRYVTFALANEFHLIASTFGVNINTIIDACNSGYLRLNLPGPGPNVGGPCLYKDGWFLIDRIPFNGLITSAFRINEGMPMQIVLQLESMAAENELNKVVILGMTFKADIDDLRNSLSLKLQKQFEARGIEVIEIEPNVDGFRELSDMANVDAVVLMTPHREFGDLSSMVETVDNPHCIFVDIWGFWPEMRDASRNGYFFASEIMSQPARTGSQL